MSTDMTWQINSASVAATEQLGQAIGRRLQGSEVIELISDLGGGKTALVRGIAAGMGSTDMVSSPSFTISRSYNARGLQLHHFDFYRLHDPGIMADELAELLDDPTAVVAIEWATIVEGILPAQRIAITIAYAGGDSRTITIGYPQMLAYAIPTEEIC